MTDGMSWRRWFAIFLAVALAITYVGATSAADGSAAQENLIPDGGFETDADGNGRPDGWSLDGKGAWQLEQKHAFAGKVCLKTSTRANNARLLAPVKGNVAYRFGYAYKSNGKHMLRLTWLTKAKKNIPVTIAGTAHGESAMRFAWKASGGTWRHFARDILAPPQAGNLKLFIENLEDVALALDNVSLVALGPVTVPEIGEQHVLFQERFDSAALMQANGGAFTPRRGAAVEFVPGKTGKAMRCLDSDGACRYPAFGRINMTQGSMECRLQTTGVVPPKIPGRFMPNIFQAGFIRVQFYSLRKQGKPAKGIMVMAMKDGGEWGRYVTTLVDQWKPDEWHHLAVTWQVGEAAAEIRAYIDGVKAREFTVTVQHAPPGRPEGKPLDAVVIRQATREETFAVGAAHACRPEFAYAIDDLRIWDTPKDFAASAPGK